MKKYFIVLAIAGLLAAVLACNGKSPLSPAGNGSSSLLDCTDFSGIYEITFHNHNCFGNAKTKMKVEQIGKQVWISVGASAGSTWNSCLMELSGPINCAGDFTANGNGLTGTNSDIVYMAGSFATMSGTAGCDSYDSTSNLWDTNHSESGSWHCDF